MSALIHKLWAGELPMARAFWEFAVLYGLVINLSFGLASMLMMSAEAPTVLAVIVYFLPVPYNLLVLVAVWRSARRYQGPQKWADLARITSAIWTIGLSAI